MMNLSSLLLVLAGLLVPVGILAAAAMRASRSGAAKTPAQQLENPYRRFYTKQPSLKLPHRRRFK